MTLFDSFYLNAIDVADGEVGVEGAADFEEFFADVLRLEGDAEFVADGDVHGDFAVVGEHRAGFIVEGEFESKVGGGCSGFCFDEIPEAGAGEAVLWFGGFVGDLAEPGPADGDAAAVGDAGFVFGAGADVEDGLLAFGDPGEDLSAVEGDGRGRGLGGDLDDRKAGLWLRNGKFRGNAENFG